MTHQEALRVALAQVRGLQIADEPDFKKALRDLIAAIEINVGGEVHKNLEPEINTARNALAKVSGRP